MRKESKKTDEYKNIFGSGSRSHSADEGVADWSNADPGKILDLIAAASTRGGAVRFGYTRDGGAYAVGLYYGEDYATKYCRPSEDVDDFLADWAEFFRNIQQPKTAKQGELFK